jgi:hypothetical protein
LARLIHTSSNWSVRLTVGLIYRFAF